MHACGVTGGTRLLLQNAIVAPVLLEANGPMLTAENFECCRQRRANVDRGRIFSSFRRNWGVVACQALM